VPVQDSGHTALMDRRWRGQQGQEALKSLRSFHEFKDQVPILATGFHCSSVADVYSTYSCLHAAGREIEVCCSPDPTFVYLQVLCQFEVRTQALLPQGSCPCYFTARWGRCNPLLLTLQGDTTQAAAASSVGQDVVVPVSANYTGLTPAFLDRLLDVSPVVPPCIVLAIVDSDGTVVLNRLHRGIHAPAEGFTGTDTLGTGKRNKGTARQQKQAKHQ